MEPVQETLWLVLVYKVPRDPTAARAAIWRKLKRLNAHLLHDAAWVLPATPWTREHLQWLTVEIVELGGEAFLWELGTQEQALMRQFQAPVEAAYQEILTELEQANADLIVLSRRYQQVHAQDYFQSEIGTIVRTRLLSTRGGHTS